jgi:hypothetical protein
MNRDKKLGKALAEVRSAYRLLWSYQKRIFDIIRLIADEFGATQFSEWSVDHASRPCRSFTDPGPYWAWDMLPMMNSSYFYVPDSVDEKHPRRGDWGIEVYLISDTGFEESTDQLDPDPMEFKSVDECASRLGIFVWKYQRDSSQRFRWEEWEETDYPEKKGEMAVSPDGTLHGIGWEIDIADLPDANAVKAVVSELKRAAAEHLDIKFEQGS